MAGSLIDALVGAQVEGASIGQTIGAAGQTAAEALVSGQVAGAVAGTAAGPAFTLSQLWTYSEMPWWVVESQCKGILQTVVSFFPGNSSPGQSGGGSGSGTGGPAGVSPEGSADGASVAGENTGAVSGQAQAAAAVDGGSGNPLVNAQIGGAEAGDAIGPAYDVAQSIPTGDSAAPWLGQSPVKGVLGSEVGGILFDKCADVLTDLEEITGAYWDSQTGSLVMIGRRSECKFPVTVSLPELDKDHLFVALRAAIAGDELGVSIDPPAEYRDGMMRGQTPPDGTDMLVSYLGHTRGTLFGAIMFEADRLLKCLDKGVDNKNRRKRVHPNVPGFKPLLEMIHPGDNRGENVWHRFWFVIDRVEIKRDTNNGAFAFGAVKLKVLTETERDGSHAPEAVDPLDAAFANHITQYYDEYAREIPIFARLKELAKIAAIANYLCSLKVPLDLDGLFSTSPASVKTPDTTPGISVTSPNVEVRRQGSVTHTRAVSLFGGVSLKVKPVLLDDDGTARLLEEHARLARPHLGVNKWSFRNNGDTFRANATRLYRSLKEFRTVCTDLQFSSDKGGLNLQFSRIYSSASLSSGKFGQGWDIFVPYKLTVIKPSEKRAEVLTARERDEQKKNPSLPILLMHDLTTGQCDEYRPVEKERTANGATYCRVLSTERRNDGCSFTYDPGKAMHQIGDRWRYTVGSDCYDFDKIGQLVEIRGREGSFIRYDYADSLLVSMRNERGKSFSIKYDVGYQNRVASISSSDGRVVSYRYDAHAYLSSVSNRSGIVGEYQYDESGHLSEIRDASGRVVTRCTYNDLGDLISGDSDVAVNGFGGQLKRIVDQECRLVSAHDTVGTCVEYEYGNSGELRRTKITAPNGQRWDISYDTTGRLVRFQESTGLSWNVYYDAARNINRIVSNRGQTWEFVRDDRGRVNRALNEENNGWDAQYDTEDCLSHVRDPEGHEWIFTYKNAAVDQLNGLGANVHLIQRADTLALRTTLRGGWWRQIVVNKQGRTVKIQSKGAEPLSFEYDQNNKLCAVSERGGDKVTYRVNERDLTVKVSFK